ncbi:MAG: hypothetical protein KKD86_05640 [Bacteroidetes bacterium]|nr:hypothetical protein [Bacteroidota bacterium]
MKPYEGYSYGSISMVNINNLINVIRDENKQNKIKYIIETGTYIGIGSTRALADIFINEENPPMIITIEANWRNWRKSKKNLQIYSFVKPIWGFSVLKSEAHEFILKDYALLNHDEFPDIFIDGGNDPLGFYLKELSGELGNSNYKILNFIIKYFENKDKNFNFSGEDLLRKYLLKYKYEIPLIALDSSGSIGLLEFNIVKEIMGVNQYYLLLDDINHLKHFRSYEEIKHNIGYKILMVDEQSGWVFVKKT